MISGGSMEMQGVKGTGKCQQNDDKWVGCDSVAEFLPGMHKDLDLVPSTTIISITIIILIDKPELILTS
jgi:hypothetical protein